MREKFSNKDRHLIDTLYKIDGKYYYVYEHWINNEIIYIGKGRGNRAYDFQRRSDKWIDLVAGREKSIDVVIKGYFKEEEEAFVYEELLISKYSVMSDSKDTIVNITHNPNVEKVKFITKDFLSELKKKSLNYKNKAFFYHHSEINSILNEILSKDMSKKVIIFTTRNNKWLIDDLKKNNHLNISFFPGFKSYKVEETVKRIKLNENTISIKENSNVMIYPIEILNNYLVEVFSEETTSIIVDSFSSTVLRNVEMIMNNKVDCLYVKMKKVNNDEDYTQPVDVRVYARIKHLKLLNEIIGKELTREDKDNLSKKINVRRNTDGRLVKWDTIMKVLISKGYTIKNKRPRVNGKQVTVTIVSDLKIKDENEDKKRVKEYLFTRNME